MSETNENVEPPLDGVRVVELGVWIAGPAAAGVLADWGAEVIKVESPGGDPQRHILATVGREAARLPPFEVDNRGKRSIVLDLKTDVGLRDMHRLLAEADVFVTNLRVEALRRLGLDPDELRERYPALVYGLVTGYGTEGPDADRAAYDVAGFWARSGVANAFTAKGGEPPLCPPSFGDHITATGLVGGVCAALVARARTGRGRLVETSLLRSGIWAGSADLSLQVQNGTAGRTLARHEAPNPMLNGYRCADDRWLWLILLESDRHWPALSEALGDTALAADERFGSAGGRAKNRRELIARFGEIFATKNRDEWGEILDAHGVWWAPQADLADVVADPQVTAARAIVELPASDLVEAAATVASPVDFDRQPITIRRASPVAGEHTAEIVAEFGLES